MGRLEINCQDLVRAKTELPNDVLDSVVSWADVVVPAHVIKAAELGLGYKGVPFRAKVAVKGGTNRKGEDIGLAILLS